MSSRCSQWMLDNDERKFHCTISTIKSRKEDPFDYHKKMVVYSRDQMSDKLENSTQPEGWRGDATRNTGLERFLLLFKFGFGSWIVWLTCSRLG